MPVSGAALGFARHFTDRRIDVYGHRPGAGTRTRGPGAAQRHTQGLVQLANVTLGERTQERSQRGRGHHLKGRATPDSSPRLVDDPRGRCANRPPASTLPTSRPYARPSIRPATKRSVASCNASKPRRAINVASTNRPPSATNDSSSRTFPIRAETPVYHGYCPRSEALSAYTHPQPTKPPIG